jgi:hypothetical protein
LAGPEGKRGAIETTIGSVRDKLFDKDGDLETDPEQLYGVRKHINDMLAPAAQRDNPEFQAASRNLIDLKKQLDDVIEGGAPGFKNYIDAYSQGAGPIEGMRFLQGLNLTDRFGDQTLGRLDQAIKQIDRQRNLPGARPADSISDDLLKLSYLHILVYADILKVLTDIAKNLFTFITSYDPAQNAFQHGTTFRFGQYEFIHFYSVSIY